MSFLNQPVQYSGAWTLFWLILGFQGDSVDLSFVARLGLFHGYLFG
jgi:hypothetical protein